MILLEHLKAICSNLNEQEKKIIKKTLKVDSSILNPSLQLFDSIMKNPELSFEELSNIIYGTKNYEALKKLIQRLIDKLLDMLISKEMIGESNLFVGSTLERLTVRRKMLHYDVLNMHNVSKYSMNILENIIDICKRIEYYDYLIIALEKKMKKISLAEGTSLYEKIFEEIEFYTDCNISLKRARYLLRFYFANNKYKQDIFTLEELKKSVSDIHADFKRTKSNSIKFHYHILKGIVYDNENDMLKARNNYLQLYKYILKKPEFFSDTDLLVTLTNIINCETLLYNFNSSLNYLQLVNSKTSNLIFNKKMLVELEFVNYFYLADWKKCYALKDSLLEEVSYSKIPTYVFEKRYFYFACLEFINGNYKNAVELLNHCRNLERDKSGWNLGVRLLLILINIELERFALVDSLIENFRKHLSRLKRVDINPRFDLILKILVALERNSFDFTSTCIKCAHDLTRLEGQEKRFRVDLLSPEIVIFHDWLYAKSQGQKYDQLEVVRRLKRTNLKRK